MASIFRRFTDPRKPPVNTSYDAKGSTPAPSEVMREEGSSRPIYIPDVVPQLVSRPLALRTYKEMEDGDTTFDVAMRSAKVPIQTANFFIQPFDDTQENKDIAEFVDYNIFSRTSKPFVLVLEDILRMFNDGWAIIEQVWEDGTWAPKRAGANRKNYTMLKKLAARPAMTIKSIEYDDNGGPKSIIQNAVRGDGKIEEVTLDLDKLLLFTFSGVGGDIQGKPLGRTAYQPWYFKKELYKIDAIGHERTRLGIPVMTLPEGYSSADKDAAWEMVTSIRTNEKTGVVEPPGYVFRFEKGESMADSNIMASIEHHDGKILLNVFAQFLLLGLTGGGGRATSGSQVDMFQKAMKYLANYICGVFNLYLIPKLVGYNYDTTKFPEMRVRNIGETKDLQMWASAISNLLSQQAITPDFETEQWVREQMDMPYKEGDSQTPIQKTQGSGRGSVDTQNTRSGTGNTNTQPGFESTAG